MHAPFETVAKLDCYETYKGMKAVYRGGRLNRQLPPMARPGLLPGRPVLFPAFCP